MNTETMTWDEYKIAATDSLVRRDRRRRLIAVLTVALALLVLGGWLL